MIILNYYILFSVSLVLSGIYSFFRRGLKHSALIYIFPIIASMFLASRSLSGGYDTRLYIEAFLSMANQSEFSLSVFFDEYQKHKHYILEPLFSFFMYLTSRFTSSGVVYLFVYSFFCTFILIKSYKNFTEKYVFAFFMFLCSFTFVFLFANAIRQAGAVSIFIFAVSLYIKDRNTFKYMLLILLASMFHVTAIFFLIVPLLIRFKIYQLFIILFMLVCLSFSGFVYELLNIFPMPEILNDKLNIYFSRSLPRINFTIISFFIFTSLGSFVNRKNKNLQLLLVLKVYVIVFLVSSFFLQSDIAFNRFSAYRFLLEPILIILILDNQNKNYKMKWGALTVLVFLYFLLLVSTNLSIVTTLSSTSL
ncbi:EpsG family protein [Marinicellulosiphila megalodicopiae]|uniref:EpsG family protein n=1 Tax=Marinicellulosiphila megalodicopiae TaxID=2724896 RepID=UPI003BAE372F